MKDKLLTIVREQKELSKKIGKENGDDIHSVLRTKGFIDEFLELEVEKNLLMDLLIHE